MLAALLDRGRWCGGGRRARLKFSMNLLCNDLYSKQANRIKVTRYTDRDVDKKCYSKFVGPLVRWETCGIQRRQRAFQRAPLRNILGRAPGF